MTSLPIIATPRLVLRPLRTSDEADFLALAGDWDVARMTSDIPHPLLPQHARHWLKPLDGDVRFGIELYGRMIGSAGYFRRRSGAAELGFWLGRDHWGCGFATEAALAVVRHGFETDGHDRFSSAHFVDNPASGRVLAKLGFVPNGQSRMWCAARGVEVEANTFHLARARAEALLGPLAAREKKAGTRVGRWIDQARRALRDPARM